MGVDYLQRKTAKKRNKRAARDGAKNDDKGSTRDRKKKVTPKRRAGVCYGQPVVTLEDKRVTDDEDSDGNAGEEYFDVLAGAQLNLEAEAGAGKESNRTKRLRSAVPVKKCGQFEKGARNAKAEAAERKREVQKLKDADFAAGKVKLSTAVNLGKPDNAAAQAAKGGVDMVVATDGTESFEDVGQHEVQEGQVADSTGKVIAQALLPYHQVIRSYMAMQKFVEPTEVQAKTWPSACEGMDILAKAQPGAGKTLAFLLPVACHLIDNGHGRHTEPHGPLVIVLAPTRELAIQTHNACKPLMPLYGLRSTCIYGGVDKDSQIEAFRKRPHIVIATPGRLLDMMDDMAVDLRHVQAIVLDECDKMLSLGFKAQLDRLHDVLMTEPLSHKDKAIIVDAPEDGKRNKKRAKENDMELVPSSTAEVAPWRRAQVLLMSATMPQDTEVEANRWLGPSPLRLDIEPSPLSISDTITQTVQVCAEHKKPIKLLKHLEAIKASSKGDRTVPRVLVFCNRIKTVRFLYNELKKADFKMVMLHGDRNQTERDAAVRDFKAGKAQIMIATDVAARGLHVKNLPYIVNYDFPGNLETYIHRVGRTGRLQAYGHAFTFFTRNLVRVAPDLVACLKEHKQSLDPNLVQLADAYAVVLEKLGPEGIAKRQSMEDKEAADEDEQGDQEADEVLLADDIEEGLGAEAPSGKQPKAAKSHRNAGRAVAANDGIQANSAVGLLPPLVGAERQKPGFIASKRFSGKREGYVFKKGPKGQGFYTDTPPVVVMKGKRKLEATQQPTAQRQPEVRTEKRPKAAKKPNKSPYDDDDDEDMESIPANTKITPIKPQLGGKASILAGGSTGTASKKKAIPGRLRKKLNKMKAQT